jgi:hypothetical protein
MKRIKTFEDFQQQGDVKGLIGHEVYYSENNNDNEEIESFNGKVTKIWPSGELFTRPGEKDWMWTEILVTQKHDIIDPEKSRAEVGQPFKVLAKIEHLQELIDKGKTAIEKNARHGAYKWIHLDD